MERTPSVTPSHIRELVRSRGYWSSSSSAPANDKFIRCNVDAQVEWMRQHRERCSAPPARAGTGRAGMPPPASHEVTSLHIDRRGRVTVEGSAGGAKPYHWRTAVVAEPPFGVAVENAARNDRNATPTAAATHAPLAHQLRAKEDAALRARVCFSLGLFRSIFCFCFRECMLHRHIAAPLRTTHETHIHHNAPLSFAGPA